MRIVFIFLTFLFIYPAVAQTEFSLYRLNASLPQANMLNPAFAPNSKVVIGLPIVSSIYLNVDNDGIAFRDIFMNSESDSLKLDTLSLFSKLKPSHRVQFNESLQLFYFGLRGKKGYFSFGIHQVMETRFHYPGDLIGWAIRGPGSYHYSGKPLDLGNFYAKSIVYNKISVNYAREITPYLRLGARFNYLVGVAAGETTDISGAFTIGTDSVSLNTGVLRFQTAGVDFFDQSNLDVSDYRDYLLKGKNKGMSFDFGATYDLTDNLMLSAAVNDLGFINWKDYTRSYQVDPINYSFHGFDLLDYLNQSGGDQFLEAEIDSIGNLFNTTESTGGQFKTSLTGKFYAGINWRVLRINNFSALFYLDMFRKRLSPAVSVGYNLQLGRTLNATMGVTFQDGRINNVGAGLALKLTHLQFYATSDRANSYLYPARASRADAHLGMNLVFGKPKKPKDNVIKKVEEVQEPVVEEPAQDTVEAIQEPVVEPQDTAQEVQETIVEPVQLEEQLVVEEVVEEIITEEPRYETVTRGTHPEELAEGNYVIVGAFRQRENAARYSSLLLDAGYENQFGFSSAKQVYYVYVHQSASLEETRAMRDQFRAIQSFQFPESWVLTVE